MCYYHPIRAKERSIWLYNHILRSRSSFLKFARRQLKRKCTGDTGITKITLKEYLRDNLQCWCLRLCLGSDKQICCLLCGEIFRESDQVKPIRCQTPGCPGTYCEQCFNDLQNLCTVCLDPVQYGDLSDISEAKGSSSEDNDELIKYRERNKKNTSESHLKNTLSDENQEDDGENYGQDISALLIPYPENERDSYQTDEEGNVSSDYSYSYQETKDISSAANYPIKMSFADVEKQHIPDYVSMATFHDDYNPEISQFETSSYITDYDKMTIPTNIGYDEYNSPPDDALSTDRRSRARAFKDKEHASIVTKSKKQEDVLYEPQVDSSNRELGFASGSSYITELEEVIDYLSPRSPKEIKHETIPEGDIISITLTTNDKYTESTSVSVPELDLSFLNDDETEEERKSSCKCENPLCTRQPCTCKSDLRFDGSVKVDVIDETSRSASSDLAPLSATITRMMYINSTSHRHQLPLPKGKYDGVPSDRHGSTSYYQSESSKSLSVITEGSQNLESSSQISQTESTLSSLNNTLIDCRNTPPNTSSGCIALTKTKAKMNIFESSDSNRTNRFKINPSEYYRKLNRKNF